MSPGSRAGSGHPGQVSAGMVCGGLPVGAPVRTPAPSPSAGPPPGSPLPPARHRLPFTRRLGPSPCPQHPGNCDAGSQTFQTPLLPAWPEAARGGPRAPGGRQRRASGRAPCRPSRGDPKPRAPVRAWGRGAGAPWVARVRPARTRADRAAGAPPRPRPGGPRKGPPPPGAGRTHFLPWRCLLGSGEAGASPGRERPAASVSYDASCKSPTQRPGRPRRPVSLPLPPGVRPRARGLPFKFPPRRGFRRGPSRKGRGAGAPLPSAGLGGRRGCSPASLPGARTRGPPRSELPLRGGRRRVHATRVPAPRGRGGDRRDPRRRRRELRRRAERGVGRGARGSGPERARLPRRHRPSWRRAPGLRGGPFHWGGASLFCRIPRKT